MEKIIITTQGGVITGIASTTPDIKIIVNDWDEYERENRTPEGLEQIGNENDPDEVITLKEIEYRKRDWKNHYRDMFTRENLQAHAEQEGSKLFAKEAGELLEIIGDIKPEEFEDVEKVRKQVRLYLFKKMHNIPTS